MIACGERIRGYRERRGRSLRGLARRAGLSHRYLALIEQDRANPSLRALLRLAAAMDVPVSELVRDSPRRPAQPRDAPAPATLIPSTGRRRIWHQRSNCDARLLTAEPPGRLEITLDEETGPGLVQGLRVSSHGAKCVVVLEGAWEVSVDNETFLLDEGDCLTFDAARPHGARPVMEGRCRAIWACTPPALGGG